MTIVKLFEGGYQVTYGDNTVIATTLAAAIAAAYYGVVAQD